MDNVITEVVNDFKIYSIERMVKTEQRRESNPQPFDVSFPV